MAKAILSFFMALIILGAHPAMAGSSPVDAYHELVTSDWVFPRDSAKVIGMINRHYLTLAEQGVLSFDFRFQDSAMTVMIARAKSNGDMSFAKLLAKSQPNCRIDVSKGDHHVGDVLTKALNQIPAVASLATVEKQIASEILGAQVFSRIMDSRQEEIYKIDVDDWGVSIYLSSEEGRLSLLSFDRLLRLRHKLVEDIRGHVLHFVYETDVLDERYVIRSFSIEDEGGQHRFFNRLAQFSIQYQRVNGVQVPERVEVSLQEGSDTLGYFDDYETTVTLANPKLRTVSAF